MLDPDCGLASRPAIRSCPDFLDLNPEFRPAGKPSLRDSAVLIAITVHDDGFGVLLTRRADTLRSHTGQIAFPGGRCDEGETSVQAALREAHEEIGLDPAFVDPVGIPLTATRPSRAMQ